MAFRAPAALKERLDQLLQHDQLQERLTDPDCVLRIATASGGRWVFVTDNAESLFGIAAEDFLGKNAFDFVPSDDVEKVRATFDVPDGSRQRNWYRTRRGDGDYMWVRGTAWATDGFIVACIRREDDPDKQYIHSEPYSELS